MLHNILDGEIISHLSKTVPLAVFEHQQSTTAFRARHQTGFSGILKRMKSLSKISAATVNANSVMEAAATISHAKKATGNPQGNVDGVATEFTVCVSICLI